MNTNEKSAVILAKIVEIANSGKAVTLSDDWGGNSLTLEISGQGHTHVGDISEGATFEHLIDTLFNALHGGPGLSWANPEDEEQS